MHVFGVKNHILRCNFNDTKMLAFASNVMVAWEALLVIAPPRMLYTAQLLPSILLQRLQ